LSSNQVFTKGENMDWMLEDMSKLQGRKKNEDKVKKEARDAPRSHSSPRRASNPLPVRRGSNTYDRNSSRSGSYIQSYEPSSVNSPSSYLQVNNSTSIESDHDNLDFYRERSGHSQVHHKLQV